MQKGDGGALASVFSLWGKDDQQGNVFSYVSADERIPADHPLRAVRRTWMRCCGRCRKSSTRFYADSGRHSIAPERLLRALLLQCFTLPVSGFYRLTVPEIGLDRLFASWNSPTTFLLAELL